MPRPPAAAPYLEGALLSPPFDAGPSRRLMILMFSAIMNTLSTFLRRGLTVGRFASKELRTKDRHHDQSQPLSIGSIASRTPGGAARTPPPADGGCSASDTGRWSPRPRRPRPGGPAGPRLHPPPPPNPTMKTGFDHRGCDSKRAGTRAADPIPRGTAGRQPWSRLRRVAVHFQRPLKVGLRSHPRIQAGEWSPRCD